MLFFVLTLAGGNDVLAFYFSTDVELLTRVFRVIALVAPVVSWIVVYRLCRTRLGRDVPAVRPGHPPGGIALRRTEAGGFEEVGE
jgi:ubiquinol-cytochrome c reductase cytochrome b subunit